MHPELAAAFGRLDAVTRDLRAVAAAMPTPLRGQKPSAERWCVNEVLEHIGLVEELFVKALVTNIEAAKAAGLAQEVDAPALLSDDLQTVVEDRSSRRSAPERVLPAGQVDVTASLQTIEALHAQLREVIASADGLALSAVTHDHRFFGTLNVYQWVDLLAGHERRHLAQVREIVAQVSAL
jgi:hypothetical protein